MRQRPGAAAHRTHARRQRRQVNSSAPQPPGSATMDPDKPVRPPWQYQYRVAVSVHSMALASGDKHSGGTPLVRVENAQSDGVAISLFTLGSPSRATRVGRRSVLGWALLRLEAAVVPPIIHLVHGNGGGAAERRAQARRTAHSRGRTRGAVRAAGDVTRATASLAGIGFLYPLLWSSTPLRTGSLGRGPDSECA